jgi:hypothetical protein
MSGFLASCRGALASAALGFAMEGRIDAPKVNDFLPVFLIDIFEVSLMLSTDVLLLVVEPI